MELIRKSLEIDTTGSTAMEVLKYPEGLDADWKVVVGNPNANSTLTMGWDVIYNGLHHYQCVKKNEELLLTVTRNFIRKMNFSELNDSLEEGDITEEQFEQELEANRDKYAIHIKPLDNPDDIVNIVDLVAKVGENIRLFNISEVSEMFSIRENDLLENVKRIN